MLAAPTDTIFNQASTGAGDNYSLGRQGTPGKSSGIGSPQIIMQFITAGTFTVDVEASLDGGTTWMTWVSAFDNTMGEGLIIENAPVLTRINATAISGNLQVIAQQFIAE